ncbi:MAG: bifunctional DNA primase/polymerase [Verrucomicrobiales bacterium]|nr:bifunctional DNA primase/polymerase [Verrucomicrobiales bacterium]
MATTLETALTLLEIEKAVCIPVGPDKRPKVSWRKYTETLPTKEDYCRWFDNGAAVAILGGSIQCLDVDTKHADAGLWNLLLQRCEDVGLGSLLERLLIQRTPSGGYHLVWRCDAELRERQARRECQAGGTPRDARVRRLLRHQPFARLPPHPGGLVGHPDAHRR